MVIAVALIAGFLISAMSRRALVPGRLQSMAEISYEFIANMVRENLGEEGMRYFPWVFTIFMFILVLQPAGHDPRLVHRHQPHHRDLRACAPMVWLVVTLIGFWRHGVGFLQLFVPAGVPWWLLPIIVPIELISYCIRPISHLGASVRQHDGRPHDAEGVRRLRRRPAACSAAGRRSRFIVGLHRPRVPGGLPAGLIFTVLTCIYLNDAVNMHH